jgi:Arc/MetJ family transcription regulator
MKTTVEIPDALLREAKRVALRERTTVRALVEQGLRQVVRSRGTGGFVLRDASFTADGLQPGRSLQDWETIRDLAYAERGA